MGCVNWELVMILSSILVYVLLGIVYVKFWEKMIRKNKLVMFHEELIVGYKSIFGSSTIDRTEMKQNFSFLEYQEELICNVLLWGFILCLYVLNLISNGFIWVFIKISKTIFWCITKTYKAVSKIL